MFVCISKRGFPVLCILFSWLFSFSRCLSSSRYNDTNMWHQKLNRIKQLSQRSVDADLSRLHAALGDYKPSEIGKDEHWFTVDSIKNHTDWYVSHRNDTWPLEAPYWTYSDANLTETNRSIHQTQSDSGIVEKAYGMMQRPAAQSKDDLYTTPHQPHSGQPIRFHGYQPVDWWNTIQVILSSFTLLVHSSWFGWSFMHHLSCWTCCPVLRQIDRPHQYQTATFHSKHRIYLRIQIHLSIIGSIYAISVIVGKLVGNSEDHTALTEEYTSQGPVGHFHKTDRLCNISRTLALLTLTVYWLNLLLCCVLSTRCVHRIPYRTKCEFYWTKSHTETFLCYFHFGASWIYAILLHLCGLMFTHFPPNWSDKLLDLKSPTPTSTSRIRFLSIDCQITASDSTGSLFGHSCRFSLSEYILAVVLSFLGDIIPILAVVSAALFLVISTKRLQSRSVLGKMCASERKRSTQQPVSYDTPFLSTGYLLTPSRDGWRRKIESSTVGAPETLYAAFTCFGLWMAVLGFGFLLTHSIRLGLHIHQLRFHNEQCKPSATANFINLNRKKPNENISGTDLSKAETGWWWLFLLGELIELTLTVLVPVGFINLTKRLKIPTGSQLENELDRLGAPPVSSETLDILHDSTNPPVEQSQLGTVQLNYDPASNSVKSGQIKPPYPVECSSLTSTTIVPPIEPCELLNLSQFTRTEFEQVPTRPALFNSSNQQFGRPDLCAHLCRGSTSDGETAATLICTKSKPSPAPIPVQVVSLHAFCCQAGQCLDAPVPSDGTTGASNPEPGVSFVQQSATNVFSETTQTGGKTLAEWVPTDSSIGVLFVPSGPITVPSSQ